MVCRGGSANRPYHTVSTNHVFVGTVHRPSLQIDLLPAAPINRFVGAVTVHFFVIFFFKFTIQIRPEHIYIIQI